MVVVFCFIPFNLFKKGIILQSCFGSRRYFLKDAVVIRLASSTCHIMRLFWLQFWKM